MLFHGRGLPHPYSHPGFWLRFGERRVDYAASIEPVEPDPRGRKGNMRILGVVGIVLALAICGYLVVSYWHEGTKIQETFQAIPGASGTDQAGAPMDVTKQGLEQRFAPTLEQERQRVEQANRAASQ